jgi:pimeloyl-ACP methyl ester carboxylesterase
MYGSYTAVRLMRAFYHEVRKRYNLDEKANLFGFSRGGLYAFNFALFYPEYVRKIYLDAPVLDMKVWPREDSREQAQMFAQYCLNKDTFARFCDNPVDNMQEFFAHKIPLLIVAGDSDQVVDFNLNSKKVIDYCNANNIPLKYIVKNGCKHHPHSLEDVTPIINFIERG